MHVKYILSNCLELHLEHIPNTEYEWSLTGTSFCFLSLVTFITLLPYDQGDETRNAPNFRHCTNERKENEKLHSTMNKSFVFSWLRLLVVYTFWYVSGATSVLCSSRRQRRFPSSPASSGAGCDYGHRTWLPSSLSGCSLAEGRVRGSARSPPLRGHAAPWGFSSDESPLLRAPPLTRDASTHHASLWHRGGCVTKCKHIGSHHIIYIGLKLVTDKTPDLGGIHLLLWALATDGLTGEGMGGLFFRGGRPGPFFFTVTSDFSFTSSFSSSASESSEKESAEFPDITAGQNKD